MSYKEEDATFKNVVKVLEDMKGTIAVILKRNPCLRYMARSKQIPPCSRSHVEGLFCGENRGSFWEREEKRESGAGRMRLIGSLGTRGHCTCAKWQTEEWTLSLLGTTGNDMSPVSSLGPSRAGCKDA